MAQDAISILLVVAMLLGALCAYLLPTLVAMQRGHAQSAAIFALNLLLGWTVLGWVAALVWSLTLGPRRQEDG